MTSDPVVRQPLRELVQHTLIYGSGFVTVAAASFILVPVYTHELPPAEFGLLALLLVFQGLLTQIYDLGMTNSVARFYFQESGAAAAKETIARVRATSLIFVLVFGGSLTLTLIALASQWSNVLTGTSAHADLIRIIAVALLAEALSMVPLTLMRMQQRSRRFVAISLVRLFATLSLNVFFVVVLDEGVRGVLMGNAIAALAVLALLIPDYVRAARGRPSLALLRQMLRFGVPFFPVLLSGWLIDASDRFLLEAFQPRSELGYYGLAYKIGQLMQVGVSAFSMGWAPLRYRIYERPDATEVYRSLTTYYVLVSSIFAVAIGVCADPIVELVAPPSFAPAADVVPYIAAAYAVYGLFVLMVTGMGVTKKTGPMAWVGMGAAGVNFALNLVLIPEWGMYAAAVTTVLANGLLVLGSWYYSQRVYPISYDWRRIARVVLLGAIVMAVSSRFGASGVGLQILLGAAAWTTFVVSLVVFRVVTPLELRLAFNRLRGVLRGRLRFGRRAQVS